MKYNLKNNENMFLPIKFQNNRQKLPFENLNVNINEYDVYKKERAATNILRISFSVNTICSNVLYNNITEVIKDEGSEEAYSLNYSQIDDFLVNTNTFENNILGKTFQDFRPSGQTLTEVPMYIRDTQLTKDSIGFTYHCGTDIFNNHILRNTTFKTVGPTYQKNNTDFNTMSDYMRDAEGVNISGYTNSSFAKQLHIYNNDEILPFENCVKKKLHEENGWFGFTNQGKLKIYPDKDISKFDYFNVINTRNSCDFIDMCPERELFSFVPKYNKYRKRAEKNWNYCITYPSSSVKEGFSFIREKTNSLRIMYYEDNVRNSSNIDSIKLYCVSKHGLKKNDTINLYQDDSVIIRNALVTEILNDYVFFIARNGMTLSTKWYELNDDNIESIDSGLGTQYEVVTINDKDEEYNDIERHFIVSQDKSYLTEYYLEDGNIIIDNEKIFYSINKEKVNLDSKSLDISFKQVIEYQEVEYYVRIFSKLPNLHFYSDITDDGELNEEKIKECQSKEHEFSNLNNNLSFAKNIFNDNIGYVIYSDNIDISKLRDNLNRPLSELFITIFKNNKGYEKWYGKNTNIDIRNDYVEFSHCFGKLNCAFELSKESITNKNYNNVRCLNNIDSTKNTQGLNMLNINPDRNNITFSDFDEIYSNEVINGKRIEYDGDINFYGDLCYYSKITCVEKSIQNVSFRFNTAQRELTSEFQSYTNFYQLFYEEMTGDDYDYDGFSTNKKNLINNVCQRKEGYYYNPHYSIKFRSFGNTINVSYPTFYTVMDIQLVDDNVNLLKIFVISNHNLKNNDTIIIYNKATNTIIKGTVNNIINKRCFYLSLQNNFNINNENKKNFKFFKLDETIPEYANMLYDGTCRFIWRELFMNGLNNEINETVYPFANNAIYIYKDINLFVRRQDYDGLANLSALYFPNEPEGQKISVDKENNYYNEEQITC